MSVREDFDKAVAALRKELGDDRTYLHYLLDEVGRHLNLRGAAQVVEAAAPEVEAVAPEIAPEVAAVDAVAEAVTHTAPKAKKAG